MKNTKGAVRTLCVGLVLLVLCVAIGYLALAAAYCVPAEAILKGKDAAVEIFEREGTRVRVDPLDLASFTDNYTDSIMLSEAYYDGEGSPWYKAIAVPRWQVEGKTPFKSFLAIYGDGETEYEEFDYIRYWHGYAAVQRPLLALMNYTQLLMLNRVVMAAVFALVLVLLRKKNLKHLIVPFVISVLCVAPLVIARNLQYSDVAYATLLTMLGVLLCRDRKKLPYVMLLGGALTAYLDLLTYPMMALTMPLMLAVLMRGEGETSSVLKEAIGLGFFWCIGFGGMWASKWLLAAFVFGDKGWQYILEGIAERSGGEGPDGHANRLFGLIKCFAQMGSNFVGSVSALIFLGFAVRLKGLKGCLAACREKSALVPELILLIPVMWILIMGNHTSYHTWMVYRNLMVIPFGLLALLNRKK